jgi:hypothetical protein
MIYCNLHNLGGNLVAFTELCLILMNLKSEGLHTKHALKTLNLGTIVSHAVTLHTVLEGH